MAETNPQHAWGVDIGETEVRLVRVARSDGRVVVDRVHRQTVTTDTDGDPNLVAALAALPAPPAGEAVWVALPDDAVLFRRLTLPAAEDETLAQIVASQAEVVLPLPPEQMAWGWGVLPTRGEGVRVLVAAAQRPLVGQLRAAAPWLRRAVFVPQASALAAAARSAEPQWAVHRREASFTLALVGREGLLAARLVHQARELASASRQLLDEAGMQRAAVSSIAVVDDDEATVQEAARGLGGEARRVGAPGGWRIDTAEPVNAWIIAAGAALHAFDPPRPRLLLDDGATTAEPSRRFIPSRRLVIAAAVIVLAVLALWGLDEWEASRREASVRVLRAETTAAGGTARALAIGEFLERRPTPPLLVIEALSSTASDRVQLKELHYDATSGQVRISGTVQGVNELDRTLMSLKVAAPFNDVQMRSANIERDDWSFDLEAKLVPLHRFLALDGVKRKAAETGNERDRDRAPADARQQRAAAEGGRR